MRTKEEKRISDKSYRAAHSEYEKARAKAYRAANPDKVRARARAYYISHKEELKANRARYLTNRDPEKKKAQERRKTLKKHGLTPVTFASILALQGGTCSICGYSDWGQKGPCVDHDHDTGKVRGILCFRCNAALGHLQDNPQIARAAADYLDKNRPPATAPPGMM